MGANVVDAVVVISVGLFATALGFRVFGPRSGANPSLDPKHAKVEVLYRVLGPLLIIIGTALAIIAQTKR